MKNQGDHKSKISYILSKWYKPKKEKNYSTILNKRKN